MWKFGLVVMGLFNNTITIVTMIMNKENISYSKQKIIKTILILSILIL